MTTPRGMTVPPAIEMGINKNNSIIEIEYLLGCLRGEANTRAARDLTCGLVVFVGRFLAKAFNKF